MNQNAPKTIKHKLDLLKIILNANLITIPLLFFVFSSAPTLIASNTLDQQSHECSTENEKLYELEKHPQVHTFLSEHPQLSAHIRYCTVPEKIALFSVITIGQGANLFGAFDGTEQTIPTLKKLLQSLVDTENFYKCIGGIIGYHQTVESLIQETHDGNDQFSNVNFYQPQGIHLTKPSDAIHHDIKQYILNMPRFGEMYPIGGAGDRLNLLDEKSGEALPAALLPFLGRSLLAGLTRDLQSREYLYHRITGKQQITPIAMMTSQAKNNHNQILKICENASWFGRPKDSFRLFTQIQVPVISENGDWIMKGPLELLVKPGGHGVIWKTAKNNGVLDWFEEQQCNTLLIRQVNNPIANTDHGLLAFLGFGIDQKKSFGFASCNRLVGSAVGMNVLRENRENDQYHYSISNIEYTEFNKTDIEDAPSEPGSLHSSFPANTNILFADIATIKSCIKKCPIPGMIINMKSSFDHFKNNGDIETVKGGRLESTMQNIADVIIDSFPQQMDPSVGTDLKTYLTFNHRQHTLSVTKKCYIAGGGIDGTPLGGYFDLQSNYHDLLCNHCDIQVPNLITPDEYVINGPIVNILFHPAMGPLWSIISQKIRHGHIHPHSELNLDIAEVDIDGINLNGSLVVKATHPLGNTDKEGLITYGYDNGKCSLINVTIDNEGIDRTANNVYWKNDITRKECLHISLNGNAEFHAENITIKGNHYIEVPDGYRVVAEEVEGKLTFRQSRMLKPTWYWSYTFDENNRIKLTLSE
jgi:UTP--glucose-1-phosphate uridylyltransferase